MKKTLFLFVCLCANLQLVAQSLDFSIGFGNGNDDLIQKVSSNSANQVFVAGAFQGSVDFNPGAGASINSSSSNSQDIFFSRFDAEGNFLWSHRIGGTGLDRAYSIVSDSSAVYLTGTFTGTVDFNPSTGTNNLVSSGQNDIFVAKYDTAGNYIWARKIGGVGIDIGNDIALDTLGNIYVTGTFQGTADFNPGSGTNNLTASGSNDTFILRLNSSGNYQFAVKLGGSGAAVYGQSIRIDQSQNIVSTGYFAGTADFNPGSGTTNLTSAGNTDIFCVKLSSSSVFQWASGIGGAGYDYANAIVTDDSDNIYITGSFEGVVDFNSGASTNNLTASGQSDAFVLKLNASGTYQNAFKIGSTDEDFGLGIAAGSDNYIYCIGYFRGTSDFNPGVAVNQLTALAGRDAYLLKLDDQTNYQWAIRWGGWSNDLANSVAVDTQNNLWCIGNYEDIAYMNPETNASDSLVSSGLADNFISKFNQCPLPFAPLVVSTCNSFYWQVTDQTYNTSGLYSDTLTTASNCDSILSLDLTILESSSSIQNITACDYFDWDGDLYTASGTYFKSILNAAGCDSLMTLNLTLNQFSTSTQIVSACDAFIWNGVEYNSSGTYYDTIPNVAGCDSIMMLQLTLNQSTSSFQSITICDSFDWNGIVYNSSGTYFQTIPNAAGCDSLMTLELSILQSSSSIQNFSACDEFEWNGNVLTSSGTYFETIPNAAGCDSLITVNLTLVQSTSSIENINSCGDFEWNGNILTDSGTYTQTIPNAAGCDSVMTLNLTINQSSSSIQSMTVCDVFEWNGDILTDSGTYTQTIANAAGCDSLMTLNLTVNHSTASTQDMTVCDVFEWNGDILTDSGTYTQTIPNATGCDSLMTLNLIVNSVSDLSTTLVENTITANNQFASYQWLDCDDSFAIIPNATDADFTPFVSGNYAVELLENGCTEISPCTFINVVGVYELMVDREWTISPNPTTGRINVALDKNYKDVLVIVRNSLGQEIQRRYFASANLVIFDIEGERGIYLIEIIADANSSTFKVVKE